MLSLSFIVRIRNTIAIVNEIRHVNQSKVQFILCDAVDGHVYAVVDKRR